MLGHRFPVVSIDRYWRKSEETLVPCRNFTTKQVKFTEFDTCALMFSVEFSELNLFGSKITLVLFDSEVHSEICIVFLPFSREGFFLFRKIMFEYAGLVHRVN